MSAYFWNISSFYYDLKKELQNGIKTLKIATAYISLKGAQSLKEVLTKLHLDKEKIEIYCSSSFNENEPSNILEFLNSFSNAYILNKPFLHSKVYELH